MSAEAYTGPQGAKGGAYVAERPAPSVARYRLTEALAPYEGFTIVLMFPKGVVHEPTGNERAGWFFKDNRGVLVGLVGLIVLALYTFRQWSRVGRDPQKGIIIARYEAREGQTPAGLRYMKKMGYDMRAFTADVLALAVAGHLRIHKEDKFLKDEWSLERNGSMDAAEPSAAQKRLLASIFSGGRDHIVLKNTNATTMAAARDAHKSQLDSEYHPRFFKRNTKQLVIAILIAVATGILAVVTSGGFGIPAIIAIGIIMVVMLVAFGLLVRAPTQEGRALLDEIEGLRMYMSVAERDELKQMPEPDQPPMLDAKRYEAMLPYAVALDVEDAWTKKFTAAVGAAAAAQAASNMTWYSGRGPITSMGDFTSSVGSGLSRSISSASTPPGSSSGGGGGGFSGGGGGGGGGGGR
jgi:uncharacterized membrane protein YgcG